MATQSNLLFKAKSPLAATARNAFGAHLSKSVDNLGSEVDFAELKDGTLVELTEHPKNPGRKCLAAWKDGEIQFLERLEEDGRVFVPLANSEILGHI